MTESYIVITVAVVAVALTVFINVIIVAVKMGELNKTVEANRDRSDMAISFIRQNQETITITVIELRKTNERLTRELDKLIGQLTPIDRNNHG